MSRRKLTPRQQEVVNAMASGATVVYFRGFGSYINRRWDITYPDGTEHKLNHNTMSTLNLHRIIEKFERKGEPLYYDVRLTAAGRALAVADATTTSAAEGDTNDA